MLLKRLCHAFLFFSVAASFSTIGYATEKEPSLVYTAHKSYACNEVRLMTHLLEIQREHNPLFSAELHTHLLHGECRAITSTELWIPITFHKETVEVTAAESIEAKPLSLFIARSQTRFLTQPYVPNTIPEDSSPTIVSTPLPTPIPTPPKSPSHFPSLPHPLSPNLSLFLFYSIVILIPLNRFRKKQKAWRIIRKIVHHQRENLHLAWSETIITDRYGTINKERWDKEIAYFCQTVLIPALQKNRLQTYWKTLNPKTIRLIQKLINKNSQRKAPLPSKPKNNRLTFRKNMDPIDYERYCAQCLQDAGWKTEITPASGDQGVDVLAQLHGVKIAVQCKLYSRPVGNKAVQEIFAAREHWKAHVAIVVSNAGYTRSAYELAESTKVHLLHHNQLSTLTEDDLTAPRNLL